MCEILAIKGNSKGIYFDKRAIELAMMSNNDGAGYIVLAGKNGRYEEKELQRYCETTTSFTDHYKKLKSGAYLYDWTQEENAKEKIADDMFKRQLSLADNELMLMHFRLATSGQAKSNTQPIEFNNYVAIHNGVFAINTEKCLSDTASFVKKLDFSSQKIGIKKAKSEKKLIKKMLKYAGGSYSLYIYSRITKQLYYIKNDFTSFFVSGDGLAGSTRKERLPFATPSNDKLFVL